MTLEEAIKDLVEKSDKCEKWARNQVRMDYYSEEESTQELYQRASQYQQLVEWLMELKDLKGEQNNQYVFIQELMKELKGVKHLLKMAVEDMHVEDMCDVCENRIPDNFTHCPNASNCFTWRYKNRALELVGESKEIGMETKS